VTSRALTLLVWALLGAVTVGLAVLSVTRPRWLPTLRAALEALAASPWRRPLVILGWMWLGWHFFAR
jgi:hypothetical protein